MTKQKSTKRALLMSALSLLLCVSMLVGSTFAWFTDSVTSTGNKIQAGNLKIDLKLLDDGEYTSVKGMTDPIFNYVLWEPGYTEVKTFKIVNEGNLSLKYQLNVVAENAKSILANVIDVYMCFGESTATSAVDLSDTSKWWKCGTLADMMANPNGFTQGKLLPEGTKYEGELLGENGVAIGEITATIALHMQEDAGNEYQGLDLGNIDVNLVATQYTFESDSFDNQYDANAKYPLVPTRVDSEDDLVAVLSDGGYALLKSDLQTTNIVNLIGGVLDGNGNEISTENTTGIVDATGGTIQNVNLEGIKTTKQIGRIEKEFIPKIGITSTDGLTQNLVIDEVTVKNTPRAISLNANKSSVYASNSTFANIINIYNQDIAVFENCTFIIDEQANENGTAWIGLGGDMTFINCHFDENVDFYINIPGYTGTITFINCTYGNNGVQNRPFEASVDFFTYWMEYSLALYDGAFGEGDPGRINFTCIVDGTVVWEATN